MHFCTSAMKVQWGEIQNDAVRTSKTTLASFNFTFTVKMGQEEPSRGCDTEPTHLHTHTHPHVGQGRNVLAVTTASHKTSHHVTAMLTAQLSSSSSKMLPVSWLSSLPSLLVQSATAN